MWDLVSFHFGCSDFARNHSITDVEGGELPFAALGTEVCYAQLASFAKFGDMPRCGLEPTIDKQPD
jgi:hypothetical protein